MAEHRTPAGPAVFELAVEGRLGPVLRSALRPHRATETASCTVLRAEGSDRDVVELVQLLIAEGLTIESVCVAEPTAARRARRVAPSRDEPGRSPATSPIDRAPGPT